MYNCYNINICKKENLKDKTSKKIRETNGGQIKEQDVPLTWDSPQVCSQSEWSESVKFIEKSDPSPKNPERIQKKSDQAWRPLDETLDSAHSTLGK